MKKLEYEIKLIVKSDLWPEEIEAVVQEALQDENIDVLYCDID